MAKVKLNPILQRLSGKVGDLVFRRYNDRTILARTPDVDGLAPSEAQRVQQERFRQAALYGKTARDDAEVWALYEEAAHKRGQPVFSIAVADFFHPPTVDEVDVSGYAGAVGDPILVRASDDFEVVGVSVTISDADGAELEGGDAVLQDGQWLYTATTAVDAGTTIHLTVVAADRPGNLTAEEVEVTV